MTWRAAGNVPLDAHATITLGIMAEDLGDYEEAEALLSTGRELALCADRTWAHALTRYHLGVVAYGQGDLARAAAEITAAMEEADAIDDILIPA